MAKQRGKRGRTRRAGRPAGGARARRGGRSERRSSPAIDRSWVGVALCVLLSGFAALLHPTVWLRQLSAVFGTSEPAGAAVLAAIMAGLALGAALGGRIALRVGRPLWTYAMLQAGVAVGVLAVPWLLRAAGWLYVVALGERPVPPDASLGQSLVCLLGAFAVLALPTGSMGASLPLLVRHAVRHDRQVGSRVSLLLAVGLAGAAIGTLFAGSVLIPELGLVRTGLVGVVANALAAALAAWLARGVATPPTATPEPGAKRVAPVDPAARWMPPILLVSGAVSFLYAVLWTRLLSPVLGSGITAFSTLLAAFLAGIALGSAAASVLAGSRERAAWGFGLSQLGGAGASMLVYATLGSWLPSGSDPSLDRYVLGMLLPASFFIGASLPLGVRVLVRNGSEAATRSAQVCGWSTLGAMLGSVAAVLWILPALGFEGALRLGVLLGLALAAATFGAVLWRRLPFALATALLVACALLYRPARPEAVFSRVVWNETEQGEPVEEFYAVGRSATVRVIERDGAHHILTNGLREARIQSRGALAGETVAPWLTALPCAARPGARSLLVIGLGGGLAIEGVAPGVERIDVVEPERELIRANRELAGRRRYDPLADPRVRLVANDARNALRLSDARYDVIVSQPAHPWAAGASQLHTRELVRLAKEHLEEDGVFVQAMRAGFLSGSLLRSLAATVLGEFDHVRLYQPSPRALVLLGSDAPIRPEAAAGAPEHFAGLGIHGVEDWLAPLVMEREQLLAFAGDAPPGTEDEDRVATRSRARAEGLDAADLFALFRPHDVLLDPASEPRRSVDPLEWPFVAWRLATREQGARAEVLADALPAGVPAEAVLAEVYRQAGRRGTAQAAWRAVLERQPDDPRTRYELGLPAPAGAPVAAAVEEGGRLERRGQPEDWEGLEALDPVLARSRPVEAWHADALRLRASWRDRAENDRQGRAREVLALVDEALPLARGDSRFQLHLLRANAAIALEDRPRLVESTRDIVRSVEESLPDLSRPGSPRRPIVARYLLTLSAQLEGDVAPDRVRRRDAVQARLRRVVAELMEGETAP